MTSDTQRGRPGQTFDDFLKEQGTYERTTEQAVKRVLAFQLSEAMKTTGVSPRRKWRVDCTRAGRNSIACLIPRTTV